MRNQKIEKLRISRKFQSYILIGGSAFIAEYITFLILFPLLSNLVIAQSLSFAVGLMISFLGNRRITFNQKEATYSLGRMSQLWRYVTLALCNLLLSNIVIQILVIAFPALVAKLFVMGLIVAWNYIIFNKLIFKSN